MAVWQRRLRLVIALGAVALVVAVAFAFQRRVAVSSSTVSRTDPKAIVESVRGHRTRFNADKEQVDIKYDTLRVYPDGSAAASKVTVTTERAGGRTFVLTALEARIGKGETTYEFDGDVHLTASDGLSVAADRATYNEADGIVRAPGAVKFSRGRMNGSGVGFSYDKHRDVITIRKDVVVDTAPGAGGRGAMRVTSGGMMEFDRLDHMIRFQDSFKATRGGEVIEADLGVARLTQDDQMMQALELRGRSRITAPPGGVGSLQAMTGRDIDLTYAANGETLEHARIEGEAAIRVAGDAGQPPRQITADVIHMPIGADGTLPAALTARGRVELTLPAEKAGAARTIAADSLDGKGEEGKGLTSAVFTGRVQFRERGVDIDRTATSEVLEVAMKPGLSAIDEARFVRAVRFVDGKMTATAALGRYAIGAGTLDLSGSDASSPRPSMRNDQIAIDAATIQVVLDGPKVHAAGAVRSTLQPAPDGSDRKTPSMFKDDQPVSVTADDLKYDGAADRATYAGNAQLWQGETTIKAATIAIDEKTGDLTAGGEPVATTTVLMQTAKDGKKERSPATAKSKELRYDEAARRAIYSGDAYVNGPQGELRAVRIELYLKPSGDELERVEAYEGVSLTEQGRKTTGDHLIYTSPNEQYVVVGKPMKIVDECGGVTEGRRLTYLKGTDRIVVDGSEQMRTQTKGGAKCP
jgi:lipopolysaccharide export system protein LptA